MFVQINWIRIHFASYSDVFLAAGTLLFSPKLPKLAEFLGTEHHFLTDRILFSQCHKLSAL